MTSFRHRLFWLAALLLLGACSTHPVAQSSASRVERGQLISTARDYLVRGRPGMRITDRPPMVSYHATSVDASPFWRVDFETVVPAPPGYRIPPGTPTVIPQSVYLDTRGIPTKRS